jgi:hypothetical protein
VIVDFLGVQKELSTVSGSIEKGSY